MMVNADLAAGGIEGSSNPLDEEGPSFPECLSSKQFLLQNLDYSMDMFLIYTLSLSIFPGFLAKTLDHTTWVLGNTRFCAPDTYLN
ncbi:hypothetical protein SETIT_2G350600v2 [Setaria italica]|nr:hypothetical protein SETIT_2G350600v2 [Setaria italica]